jgi:hypothetical protein
MTLFLRIFVSIYLLVGGLLTVLAFSLQPYSGDLTRTGGFLENDFGWNLPQEKFKQPLFTRANSLSKYDRYYDVVVVGDSFSMNAEYGWQNYFVNATGFSLITFHQDEVDINELLQAPRFRQSPPRLFIIETVENGIQSSLQHFAKPAEVIKLSAFSDTIPIKPLNQTRDPFSRQTKMALRLDEPIHFVKMNVKRLFGSYKVFRYHLKQQSLFSCRRSDEILIYYGDRWKDGISTEEWGKVEQRLADLQEAIESNGRTKMVTMIAPDKTTVYNKYIDNLEYPYRSVLKRLPGKREVRWAPLEKWLQERIDAGGVDVYLPNDTHWGYEGHKTAAAAILHQITNW